MVKYQQSRCRDRTITGGYTCTRLVTDRYLTSTFRKFSFPTWSWNSAPEERLDLGRGVGDAFAIESDATLGDESACLGL
jgi:hypothetical protein